MTLSIAACYDPASRHGKSVFRTRSREPDAGIEGRCGRNSQVGPPVARAARLSHNCRMSKRSVAVVIPYFQKEAGLLTSACRSVINQDYVGQIDILVVDDSSPRPANEDVADLELPSNRSLTVFRQDNGGPGSARNRGLDEISGARIVAFLDSDDTWTPDHVKRAVSSLEAGYQIYIGNHSFAFGEGDAFGQIKPKLSPDDALPEDVFRLDEDFLLRELAGPIGACQCLVYDFALFADIRFPIDLRSASEDQLFTASLGAKGPKVAISKKIETLCGRGMNVHAGEHWGTPKALEILENQGRAMKFALKTYGGVPEAREIVRKNLRENFDHFLRNWINLAVRKREFYWRHLLNCLLVAPLRAFILPFKLIEFYSER